MSYKKIAQLGAGGNVGQPIFDALVASGKFELTVIGRQSSAFTTSDPSVKVVKIDYGNREGLVNALKGHDAVLITIGDLPNLEKNSIPIIDAAIEAGVKRILPSEYGNDLSTPPGNKQFIFAVKHNINAYLENKASLGKIEFTTIATGPFFDWALQVGSAGFDIANKKAIIYNGGTRALNATTLAGIGESVVGVLSNPAPWKNRHVRVHDVISSQNVILSTLEELTGAKWSVEEADADKLLADSTAGLQRGDITRENIYGVVKGCVYGSESSASWGLDDEAAAIGVTPKDLKTVLGNVLKASSHT